MSSLREELRGGGALLVLIHSLLQDEHAWDEVVLHLPTELPTYRANLGVGPVPLMVDELADDIAATTSGPLDVVGVAFGGIVAQHLMVRHRERIRSAVLANTPGRIALTPEYLADGERALASGSMAALLEPALRRWFTPRAVEEGIWGVRYIRGRFAAIEPALYVAYQRAMDGHDVLAQLSTVDVPVTLVIARQDPSASKSIHELHKVLRMSEICELEGSHMVHLEKPAEFAEIIIRHRSVLVGEGHFGGAK